MLVGQYLNGVFTRGLTGKFNTNETRTFYFVCGYCGKTFESSMRNLLPRTGRKYGKDHCGCQRTARQQQRKGIPPTNKLPIKDRTISAVYQSYVAGAKHRSLLFDLTMKDVESLIFSDCGYCGIPPSSSRTLGQGRWTRESLPTNGIDRMVNSLGYTLSNSLPCCWDCNSLKRERDIATFLSKVESIYKNCIEKVDMKIKITKASDNRMWYDKHIGEIFLVRRIDSDCYWCKPDPDDPYAGWNYVLFEHCEVYKEKD